jgi:hypothetical protein
VPPSSGASVSSTRDPAAASHGGETKKAFTERDVENLEKLLNVRAVELAALRCVCVCVTAVDFS